MENQASKRKVIIRRPISNLTGNHMNQLGGTDVNSHIVNNKDSCMYCFYTQFPCETIATCNCNGATSVYTCDQTNWYCCIQK